MSNKKETVLTASAPQPIGPYSQAIRVGNLLYCSGQIPLDPVSGEIVIPGDVTIQAAQVLKNLSEVLKASGATFANVVKTTIFLKNMEDFPKVNAVYAASFRENPPARSTIEVSRLPKDSLIEIEAIAVLD